MALPLPTTTDVQIVRMVKALFDAAPGNTYLTAFQDDVAENGLTAFANGLAAYVSTDAATLASTVVANLGLTGDSATNGELYLLQEFAANPGNYGQVILNAMNALSGMESDPIFGADAAAYNASVLAAYTYSIDADNTTTNLVTLMAADDAAAENIGQTFTLTTGVDAVAGTTGNDTINGTDTTLSAFDSINGAAGTDALNLTFAAAFDFDTDAAGATVTSVETVNVQATDTVDGDISAWTGVNNVTVSAVGAGNNVDLITAAANAVTLTGKLDVSIEDATAATVTVTAGQDIVVDADTATTVNIVTTDVDDSENDLVGVSAAAVATLSLAVVEGTTVTLDTESTSLTVDLDGFNDTDGIANNADLVIVDASDTAAGIVEALTLNVNEDLGLDLDFALATSLAVAGTADLTLTETDLGAVETLTVAGSVGLSGDLSGMAALESIVSTSTGDIEVTIDDTALEVTTGAGDDEITQAAALDATQAISTGAGDDSVILGAALTAGATVNGGDDTDTISVISAQVGTNASAVISNFEVLEISNALAAALNVANFDSIQNVVLAAGVNGSRAITGATTGFSLEMQAEAATPATDTTTITVTNAAAGTADVVNIKLNAAATANFGEVIVSDVETINVNSTTTNATPAGVTNTLAFDTITATTLNITGDAALVANEVAVTTAETVNASTFDAALTITLAGNANDVTVTAGDGDNNITGGTGDDTITVGDGDNTINSGNGDNTITAGDGDNGITGGTGDDTITTGDGDDTIDAAAGDDTIDAGDGANGITGGDGLDTMTGGADVDTYTYAAVTESQGVTVDVITNFDADEDVLDLSAITLGTGLYLGEANGYGAVLTSLTATAGDAVLDSSTSTLYVDIDGDAALTGADMAIQLTGVTTLDDATNFVW
jgi:S-layer protein